MENLNPQPKSFWKKPEGITGMLFIGAGLIGLYKTLPFIISLLSNTLYAAGLLAVLGAIIYVILDPKFRTLVSYMYKSVMRGITGLFITLNPITIIENYIRDMEEQREDMNKQIMNLRGQMKSLQNVILQNDQAKTDNLRRASKAKEIGKNDQVLINSRKAGRLDDSNKSLNALYTKLEMLYRVLTKMYETSGIVLEDTKDEVDVRKREYAALKAGSSAFKSAMKIIQGDPDKKYLFDQSMEFMANDIGNKLGEMERFMEMSSKVIESVDLDNGICESEGLAMLEKWEKDGTSILLGNDKNKIIAQSRDQSQVLNLDEPLKTVSKKKTNYAELFEETEKERN